LNQIAQWKRRFIEIDLSPATATPLFASNRAFAAVRLGPGAHAPGLLPVRPYGDDRTYFAGSTAIAMASR
jgi:hypothetical protein